MKQKIWMGISFCMAIVGIVLICYCMISENESSNFLALALLCTTVGNFINIMVHKKQKETN